MRVKYATRFIFFVHFGGFFSSIVSSYCFAALFLLLIVFLHHLLFILNHSNQMWNLKKWFSAVHNTNIVPRYLNFNLVIFVCADVFEYIGKLTESSRSSKFTHKRKNYSIVLLMLLMNHLLPQRLKTKQKFTSDFDMAYQLNFLIIVANNKKTHTATTHNWLIFFFICFSPPFVWFKAQIHAVFQWIY